MEPPWGIRDPAMCWAPPRALPAPPAAPAEDPVARNDSTASAPVVDVGVVPGLVPGLVPDMLALGAPVVHGVVAEVNALLLRCVDGALEVVLASVEEGVLADAWSWLCLLIGPPLGPPLDPPLEPATRPWWLVGLQFLAWAALLVALGVLRWDSRMRFRQEEVLREWGWAPAAPAPQPRPASPQPDPPQDEPPVWPPRPPPRPKRRKVKSAAPGLASWRVRCESSVTALHH